MAYDEAVAERIRTLLSSRSDVREQKMFGGLCFMMRGHMCCAVSGRGGLLVRVGPDAPSVVLKEPHASEVDMRGRMLTGYVRVAPDGYRTASGLRKWVTRAVDFVATLPVKTRKAPAKKAANAARRKK
jgi:TfoX/Sxy family transcriptional regulator of competence genes